MIVGGLVVSSLRFVILRFGWAVRSVTAGSDLFHPEDFSF